MWPAGCVPHLQVAGHLPPQLACASCLGQQPRLEQLKHHAKNPFNVQHSLRALLLLLLMLLQLLLLASSTVHWPLHNQVARISVHVIVAGK